MLPSIDPDSIDDWSRRYPPSAALFLDIGDGSTPFCLSYALQQYPHIMHAIKKTVVVNRSVYHMDPVSFHINPLEDVTRAVTDKNKDLAQQGTQNQPRRGKLMYVDHLLVEPISIWLLD